MRWRTALSKCRAFFIPKWEFLADYIVERNVTGKNCSWQGIAWHTWVCYAPVSKIKAQTCFRFLTLQGCGYRASQARGKETRSVIRRPGLRGTPLLLASRCAALFVLEDHERLLDTFLLTTDHSYLWGPPPRLSKQECVVRSTHWLR